MSTILHAFGHCVYLEDTWLILMLVTLHAVTCCIDHLSAPMCTHVHPCAGTQCDKLLDEVYDDLKDINLYDILWTCYHGGRARQEALMQVPASPTHYSSLLLCTIVLTINVKECLFNCAAMYRYSVDASSAASCVKSSKCSTAPACSVSGCQPCSRQIWIFREVTCTAVPQEPDSCLDTSSLTFRLNP